MQGYIVNSLAALGGLFVTKLAYELCYADWPKINERAKEDLLHGLMKIPKLAPMIQGEINKKVPQMLNELTGDIAKQRPSDSPHTTINHDGFDFNTLLASLESLKQHVPQDQLYKMSGALYMPQDDPNLIKVMTEIAAKSAYTNPLHPDIWPGLPKMSAEIMNSCLELFNAPDPSKGFGTMTTGGTVSIFEAVKAYRNRAEDRNIFSKALRSLYPAKPEIIVPSTAHAAFEKAADILGCKLVSVPVDPITQRADVKAMEAKINHNTMLMVGSLPSYPAGAIDDIEALGKVAQKHKIGLHVDACLGGFVVPFLDRAQKFGFDVPGVSSISVDSHKYGLSDKGASIVLYKDFEALGKYQTSTHVDWSGGLYATPGLSGSASGYAIASTWVMMQHFAKTGYTKIARDIANLAKDIQAEVADIPEIDVIGHVDANVVAFKSTQENINIHLVVDKMKDFGWHLNTLPNGFHFCLTGVQTSHEGFLDEFMTDLKKGLRYAAKNQDAKPKSDGAIYGATKSLPPLSGSLKRDLAQEYLHIQASVPKPSPRPS